MNDQFLAEKLNSLGSTAKEVFLTLKEACVKGDSNPESCPIAIWLGAGAVVDTNETCFLKDGLRIATARTPQACEDFIETFDQGGFKAVRSKS